RDLMGHRRAWPAAPRSVERSRRPPDRSRGYRRAAVGEASSLAAVCAAPAGAGGLVVIATKTAS
ncbi:hypothetical protein, partial [Mycobacterium tuberculosis]|uniref:hypothetical protein n=1 Tax=Mycobacterium tuberculosis TaxID=1773 RepID=UPI002551858E